MVEKKIKLTQKKRKKVMDKSFFFVETASSEERFQYLSSFSHTMDDIYIRPTFVWCLFKYFRHRRIFTGGNPR